MSSTWLQGSRKSDDKAWFYSRANFIKKYIFCSTFSFLSLQDCNKAINLLGFKQIYYSTGKTQVQLYILFNFHLYICLENMLLFATTFIHRKDPVPH